MLGELEEQIAERFEWSDDAVSSWLEADYATGRCLYVIDYRKVHFNGFELGKVCFSS